LVFWLILATVLGIVKIASHWWSSCPGTMARALEWLGLATSKLPGCGVQELQQVPLPFDLEEAVYNGLVLGRRL
jgi:hypothetical protein